MSSATIVDAVKAGTIGERIWMYANYHCNLACTYCLTESAPDVAKRDFEPDRMVEIAQEARGLGFRALGVTGGEPFLIHEMPELIARLAEILPVVVLSNGTLFTGKRLERLAPLGELPVHIQISLDRSEPVKNDEMRGPENFAKVVEVIPRLVDLGIGVRIGSTLEFVDEDDMAKLCALHRGLGVPDDLHVIRGIVHRGRALTEGLGEDVTTDDLAPELTLTVDGAFWSPFGPTVVGGRLDTDLMVTRTTSPLSTPALTMVQLVGASGPPGPIEHRFT